MAEKEALPGRQPEKFCSIFFHDPHMVLIPPDCMVKTVTHGLYCFLRPMTGSNVSLLYSVFYRRTTVYFSADHRAFGFSRVLTFHGVSGLRPP